MNANYLTTQDAAKRLGVCRATICGWCQNNRINCINVSSTITKKPMYMISEDEIIYIQKLAKKYGKKKAITYYKKDKLKVTASTTDPAETPCHNFDKEKIIKSLERIQDIKDMIENLDTEKANLIKELNQLKAEIMSSI